MKGLSKGRYDETFAGTDGKFPDILLVLSVDNFCRQFGPRSGLAKRFERKVILYQQ